MMMKLLGLVLLVSLALASSGCLQTINGKQYDCAIYAAPGVPNQVKCIPVINGLGR